MKPSTKEFLREAKKKSHFSWGKWLHGYVYGRWIYSYIALGTGRNFLGKTIARLFPKKSNASDQNCISHSYHGKVISHTTAKKIVHVGQKIEISDLEKIIPYKNARTLLLDGYDDIVVLDCPCRASKQDHCLPLAVCLVIGKPFTDFILEHHPTKSRRINKDEARDILQKCHDNGNVHHAFFKEEMLSRFYAICNCCSCCCGAVQATKKGTPMLASSGYVALVDEGCNHCTLCLTKCPFDAIESSEGKITINDNCMGCGVCVSNCPRSALSLQRDQDKGSPLDITTILQSAQDHAIRSTSNRAE